MHCLIIITIINASLRLTPPRSQDVTRVESKVTERCAGTFRPLCVHFATGWTEKNDIL